MGDEDEVTTGELGRSLKRVEDKLDKALGDHEQRLRRIERMTYVALGIAMAGGITGVGSFISVAGG